MPHHVSFTRVNETTFLGVIIDDKLRWNSHVKYLGRKISSTAGALWDMRKVIHNNLRNSVYNALVNSHLSYGISVWGSGGSENKLKPLFVIQKRCLRNLFKIRRNSKFVKCHTKTNGILTVHNLYNYFTLCDISKLYHLKIHKYSYNLLNGIIHILRNQFLANFYPLPSVITFTVCTHVTITCSVIISEPLPPQ